MQNVPRPAATVILVRPPFDVLLVKRHGKSGFMAGAHVFPGGRVEEGETHEQAAVRETREEAGIDVDASALVRYAHWITPHEEPKRFDTWFFLARIPKGTVATIDEHEAVDHAWLSPKAALSAYARREIVLAPPTMATLEDLAEFASLEDAIRAIPRDIPAVCPKMIALDTGLVLALPGDPLHDVAERAFAARTRIVMTEEGRFRSLCEPSRA